MADRLALYPTIDAQCTWTRGLQQADALRGTVAQECQSAVHRQRQQVLKLAQEEKALLAEVEFHALDREIESGAIEQLKLICSQAAYALARVGSEHL